MTTPDSQLVRIRPGKKGFKVKRYCYKGTIYDSSRGWYEVPGHLATELAALRQEHEDDESPVLFDVVSHDKAAELEESEKLALERAPAAAPNVVEGGRRRTVVTRDGKLRTTGSGSGEPTLAEQVDNQRRHRNNPADLRENVERSRPGSGDLTTADLPGNQRGAGPGDVSEQERQERHDRQDRSLPAMLDPDPHGAELATTPETGEGVVPVGRVSMQGIITSPGDDDSNDPSSGSSARVRQRGTPKR